MVWVESICHTVHCSKRAMRVAVATPDLMAANDGSPVTVATTGARVAVVVTEAEVAADAEEIVVVEIEMTAAAIVAQGVNGATSMMKIEDRAQIAQSVQNDLAETMKAAEIVAPGVQPVVMMVVADDRVRPVVAKLSK